MAVTNAWQNATMPGTSDDTVTPDTAVALLRREGLRVTRPRALILDLLITSGEHFEVAAIVERIRTGPTTISIQAAYNILTMLTGAGLIRRIEPAGRPSLFEARTGDNHHHLICRDCGSIADLDCAASVIPCLAPSNDHGYHIDEAEVCWYGRCATCQS
jgi:Fur family ferric uptake transcriptional regulator